MTEAEVITIFAECLESIPGGVAISAQHRATGDYPDYLDVRVDFIGPRSSPAFWTQTLSPANLRLPDVVTKAARGLRVTILEYLKKEGTHEQTDLQR